MAETDPNPVSVHIAIDRITGRDFQGNLLISGSPAELSEEEGELVPGWFRFTFKFLSPTEVAGVVRYRFPDGQEFEASLMRRLLPGLQLAAA